MSGIFKSLNSNIKYNLYKTLIKLATFQMMMMVGVKPYFQPGPLSETFTIGNLRHTANKI